VSPLVDDFVLTIFAIIGLLSLLGMTDAGLPSDLDIIPQDWGMSTNILRLHHIFFPSYYYVTKTFYHGRHFPWMPDSRSGSANPGVIITYAEHRLHPMILTPNAETTGTGLGRIGQWPFSFIRVRA
jgi:hypothetical protein